MRPSRTGLSGIVCALLIGLLFPAAHAALDVLPAPDVVPKRGFYDQPFAVMLSTDVVGATIRYTLDGSTPGPTQGAIYSGPIPVATTTVLRAAVFAPEQPPSAVATHTYLFLDDVIRQPAQVPGYNPTREYITTSIRDFPVVHDNEMDPEVTGHPVYGPLMRQALTSLPTMVLAVDPDRIFGAQGFYDTHDVEIPVSVEVLYPDDPARNEQIDAGIEGHAKVKNKRAFRLKFRSRYGPPKWNTDLFSESPLSGSSASTIHDRIILRSGNNRSWSMNYAPPTYTEDQFYRESQLAMSGFGSHGVYVHLFINELYWGLYNPAERPNEDFSATYFGGNADEYISISHSGVKDGDPTRWYDLTREMVTWDMRDPANYAQLQQYLDLEAFADYIILNWYIGQGDWPKNNWWAGQRYFPGGQARFYAWDGEFTWSHIGANRPDGTGAFYRPEWRRVSGPIESPLVLLWFALRASPDFMTLFHDRIYENVTHDGVLTEENNLARFDTLNEWIELAVVAESARWGDSLEPHGIPLKTRDVDWVAEVELIRSLMVGNTERFLDLMRAMSRDGNDWYPDLDPPEFNQHGGQITPGFSLVMSDPNPSGDRTLYYTTDGSDPRLQGGAVSATAQTYSGPITLFLPTTIKARFLEGNDWSAVHHASFTTGPPPSAGVSIRVTELMYNPRPGTFPPDEYEFLELTNVGSEAIDLTRLRFTAGIFFDLAQSTIPTLAPGGRVVLIKNPTAFAERYGNGELPIAGIYTGQLSNGGEGLAILDDSDHVVHSFVYDDVWHPSTDGGGFSLVVSDETGPEENWSLATGWQPSSQLDGTPGAPSPDAAALEVADAGIVEGSSGSQMVGFVVTLTAPSSTTVSVQYATVDGSALARDDYVATVGSLTFEPGGPLSQSVEVPVIGDSVPEPNETFDLMLTSATGAAIQDGVGSATIFNDEALPTLPDLRVTEIMYHPRPGPGALPPDEYEFLELTNLGSAPASLGGLQFTSGIAFDFGGAAISELQPGEALILAKNPTAFVDRYGGRPRLLGPYVGQLSNAGEGLTLRDRFLRVVQEFAYDDFWYADTDGLGFSLVIDDPHGSLLDWSSGDAWHPSHVLDGTPGYVVYPGVPSPPPTAVYREFKLNNPAPLWRVTSPHATAAGAIAHLPNPIRSFSIPAGALTHATSAEMLFDFWGGHPGTSVNRVRFNENPYLEIAQMTTTPPGDSDHKPQCYLQQRNPVIRVPLSHLVEGTNLFEGTSGPQTCFSFDWGQWGMYAVILRVYYDPREVDAPTGVIDSPNPGGFIGENPTISVNASGGGGIAQVQVLARHDNYDIDGDGIFRDFQQSYHRAKYDPALEAEHHVGTATSAPYTLVWDTELVPDQPVASVELIARIQGNNGLWYVTPVVDRLTLQRARSLRLMKPEGVEPLFWTRLPRPLLSSYVTVPAELDLADLVSARLLVKTWNGVDGGAADGEPHFTLINDWQYPSNYGQNHHFSYDVLNVPTREILPGVNTISFSSISAHHGIEILWPGPALLLEFGSVVGPFCGDGDVNDGEECDDGNENDDDGCRNDCTLPGFCGDGELDPGEMCDDGNNVSGDGCEGDCTLPATCGDGIRSPGEQCDDGNDVNGDGCDNDCTVSGTCGNGELDPGEECDDGNDTDGDGCDVDCTRSPFCGDGDVDPGEECDDGNDTDGDGCDTDCTISATCGNGILDSGEECDDGNNIDDDGCQADCTLPFGCSECGASGVTFFFNGEGCQSSFCNADYLLHPTREFSLGGSLGDMRSGSIILGEAALFGDYGLRSTSKYDMIIFSGDPDTIVPHVAGSICFVFQPLVEFPRTGGYRMVLAKSPSSESYVSVQYHGEDDLQVSYRDADGHTQHLSTGSWNGADTPEPMLVQLSYDSTVAVDSLRLVVDGVPRALQESPIVPLAGISELRIGNTSSSTGGSYLDSFLVSNRSDLDCWSLLAGTCSGSSDRCIDDGDCSAGQSCAGVLTDYSQLTDDCPDDPDKLEPGVCGCGQPDIDVDTDGIMDCLDGCLDSDGDLYGSGKDCLGADCDDSDAQIHSGAAEIVCDGIDNDCNPSTVDQVDADDDGVTCDADCNDADASIYPGAMEIACDNIDNDCDQATPDRVDADADGADCRDDCNDEDPTVHPGADELTCDGVDNDCSPATPDVVDLDLDGFTCELDCNDANAAIHPAASEIPCDGIDNDCDPATTDLLDDHGNAFTSLHFQGDLIVWDAVAGATGYDVLRGDLATLRGTGGDFTPATDVCLSDDSPMTAVATIDDPTSGNGFWYLARPTTAEGHGGYDTCDLLEGRDAEIAASGLDCP